MAPCSLLLCSLLWLYFTMALLYYGSTLLRLYFTMALLYYGSTLLWLYFTMALLYYGSTLLWLYFTTALLYYGALSPKSTHRSSAADLPAAMDMTSAIMPGQSEGEHEGEG